MKRISFTHIFIGLMIIITAALIVIIKPSNTTASASPCQLGSCPKELGRAENGGVFTYALNRHINVTLNKFEYPPKHVTCELLTATAHLEDLYPNHLTRFKATTAGQCVLRNGEYAITIIIVDPQKEKTREEYAIAQGAVAVSRLHLTN